MSDETNSRRALRAALLIAGAALFALLVWQIGPRAIAASFARLGVSLFIVLVFPFCLITAFDTLGWRYAFRRDRVAPAQGVEGGDQAEREHEHDEERHPQAREGGGDRPRADLPHEQREQRGSRDQQRRAQRAARVGLVAHAQGS